MGRDVVVDEMVRNLGDTEMVVSSECVKIVQYCWHDLASGVE